MRDVGREYRADVGPPLGPIRVLDVPKRLAVVDPCANQVVGVAELAGWSIDANGPIALFRLLIGADELPGLFACIAREFRNMS